MVGGKNRRMSSRWSSSAGRPISTSPASSAPQSRHSCRSHAASRIGWRDGSIVGVFVEMPHGRMFVEFHGEPPLFVYATIVAKKHAISESVLDWRTSWSLDRATRLPRLPIISLACCWAFSQAGIAFSISRFPCGVSRNGCVRASSRARLPASPCARIRSTLRLSVDDVQLENVADLGGAGEAELCCHDQDVHLTDLQAQRTQSLVIDVCDDPVQQAEAHGDARLGDGVDGGWWTCS